MKRRSIIALLVLVLLAVSLTVHGASEPEKDRIYADGDTGDMITRIQIRLRDLGYLCYRPTGAYRAMTADAVKAFQRRSSDYGNSLAVDGRAGPETLKYLFEIGAPRVRIPDSVHIPKGPDSSKLKATGRPDEWSAVKASLTVGSVYTVTDCYTGETFDVVFAGGENHAEMELADEDQLAAFMRICGGEYNFLKRPVVVEIGGQQIAASLQCWPHGSDSTETNGMDGHFCVFFSGSLSGVGKLPDVEHNSNIMKAAGR
ncbi:MAG: peptidoglycan-binding protein [Clostridia bacterium]|nr:peptidoglycan-binding protein [Clostridia bacterium]